MLNFLFSNSLIEEGSDKGFWSSSLHKSIEEAWWLLDEKLIVLMHINIYNKYLITVVNSHIL